MRTSHRRPADPATDRGSPAPTSRIGAALLTCVALLATSVLVACGEYPQSSIHPGSDFADIIHSLYTSIFWWTVLIGAVVWIALGYILVRFRERADGEPPDQNRGNLGLEIGWTIGPALIVVAIAIPTIQAVFATQGGPAAGEDALVVDVVGHRFWWEFRYPDSGIRTANELHLPEGVPVSLRLHSADVIHSFWVPRLGGKRDVNPVVERPEGRDDDYNWLHFTPGERGVYMGQCAEFCGEAHALMGLRVVVESEEEFEAWQQDWLNPSYTGAQQPGGGDGGGAADPDDGSEPAPQRQERPAIERGRRAFFEDSYCVLCHSINGTPAGGTIGPDLTNFGDRSTIAAGMLENTEENLVEWIRDPSAIKPGVRMPAVDAPAAREGGGQWQPTGLDEEQLRAVAAYLMSLRGR